MAQSPIVRARVANLKAAICKAERRDPAIAPLSWPG